MEQDEKGFDDFVERFKALMEEAIEYGVETALIISEDDKFRGTMSHLLVRRMNPAQCLGLLSLYSSAMHDELLEVGG